jgi:hypothetical protein
MGRRAPERLATRGRSGGPGDHDVDRGDRASARPRVGPAALPRRPDPASSRNPGAGRRPGVSLEPARSASGAAAARLGRYFSTGGATGGSGLPQGIPRSEAPAPRTPAPIAPLVAPTEPPAENEGRPPRPQPRRPRVLPDPQIRTARTARLERRWDLSIARSDTTYLPWCRKRGISVQCRANVPQAEGYTA